uniref:C2H2-type domain-containing protein n=1 Tax=Monopterus albus TaxID=43700 RepID=A0A3Q3QPN7_MONAL|nr:zinc finger protein 483-like [Monopterus albus]
MAKVQLLRSLVKQRLTVAVEEIFGLIERTVAEYEDELCRTKEENKRQRELLDAVLLPRPRGADGIADIRKVTVKEEQQDWDPSLDQHPAEPPHIKEEQEELWTSQEGEQRQGLEEADVTKFPFTPVPVKSEADEPQFSQLHQSHTEENRHCEGGEDCGGPEPHKPLQPDTDDKTEDSSETDISEDDEKRPQFSQLHQSQTKENGDCGEDSGHPEPARSLDPDRLLEPDTDDMTEDSSETDVSEDDEKRPQSSQLRWSHTKRKRESVRGGDCGGPQPARNSGPHSLLETDDMTEDSSETEIRKGDSTDTRKCQLGLNSLKTNDTAAGDTSHGAAEKPFHCPDCDRTFSSSYRLKRHARGHKQGKQRCCSKCSKTFSSSYRLRKHMRTHTGEELFVCSCCSKRFLEKQSLLHHMRLHSGEKPFSC